MRLPEDKKLVAVKYTYEDGSVFTLNEENALNFQNNIKSTSILSVRGNHYFAPVEWEKQNEKVTNLNDVDKNNTAIEHSSTTDIINDAEFIFNVIRNLIKILIDGQQDMIKCLYFDIEKISESFNIYETFKELNFEEFMKKNNRTVDESLSTYIITPDEYSSIEKMFLDKVSLIKTELPSEDEIKSMQSLTKFLNLVMTSITILKQKEQIYLSISKRDF